MHNNNSSRLSWIRLVSIFVLPLSLFAAAGWLAAQPKEEEEEPVKKKPVKLPKDEEEEPARPAPRPPLRVEEDEPAKGKQPRSRPPAAVPVADLAAEAKKAKNTAVANLFDLLAVPHDTIKAKGRFLYVVPLSEYVKKPFPDALEVQAFDTSKRPWPVRKPESIKGVLLLDVEHYEQTAVKAVQQFLTKGPNQRDAGDKEFLSRRETLRVAEKVLIAVKTFHASARDSGKRQGDWGDLEKKLNDALLAVQLDEVRALAEAKLYDDAFELANRLADAHPDKSEVQLATGLLRVQESLRALESNDFEDFRKARIRLENLERRFLNEIGKNDAVIQLRRRLRDKADEYVKHARDLHEQKNRSAAVDFIQMAESVWPQLPGLAEEQRRIGGDYQILYVGVRQLPEYMSPALASTDVERQAVELIFESLVRRIYDPRGGQRYEPVLGRPQMTKVGQQFRMVPNASWYQDPRFIGEGLKKAPVTATDVRHTVHLLRAYKGTGNVPEWSELVDEAVVLDSEHVNISLKRGYLDPMSLMTFKIVPEKFGLDRLDDPVFGRNPVGSGPFQYQGPLPGKPIKVFESNPRYKDRGKQALPRIREIQLVQCDPQPGLLRSNFERPGGRFHLYLDLPSDRVKDFAPLKDSVTVYTLPTRRVHFLAVNHKHTSLQNIHLRRAIAHALNRDKILDECFRASLGKGVHKVLNGPYLAGSWACQPKLKPDPYNLDLAKSEAQEARNEGEPSGGLTLKYPDGDPTVAQACTKIREQVLEAIGISLLLEAIPADRYHKTIEHSQDYQLAYHHIDYPDDTYWLWPYFDPRPTDGGRNFFNYRDDDQLASLFRDAMSRRQFAEVRRITQDIHQMLYDKMPLIPLWQLDKHIAVHHDLTTVPSPEHLDPLLIFTQAEEWKVEKK